MNVTFIGHKHVKNSKRIRAILRKMLRELIEKRDADLFIFGGEGEFDEMAYDIVSSLKVKYPHINRVFLRSGSSVLGDDYRESFLKRCKQILYLKGLTNIDSDSDIGCDEVLIDLSDTIVVYFDSAIDVSDKISARVYGDPEGREKLKDDRIVKIAVEYAQKNGKPILNVLK